MGMVRPNDFEDRGSGTVVTFIHGFALDRRMWAPQRDVLAASHRTLAVDLPGFGVGGGDVSGEQCPAQAILDLLDARGVERTHLVAHSFGGAIAVDVALAKPERVLSLTLVDGLLLGRSSMIAAYPVSAAFAQQGKIEEARRAWLDDELFEHARKNSELARLLEQIVCDYACGHWSLRTSNRWLCDEPIPRLHELRFPTLVINGELDSKAFREMAVEYGERLPNVRSAVIPGVGHLCSLEAPDAFNEIFTAFIASAAR
jgi:3-oxoadipate enol-lactonase